MFLYSKIEVLKVIDDDEVKFEEKKYVKELQVNFIESEGIKLNMEFFLACAYHKLNFEVHQYKQFLKMLDTMLYSKYLFT